MIVAEDSSNLAYGVAWIMLDSSEDFQASSVVCRIRGFNANAQESLKNTSISLCCTNERATALFLGLNYGFFISRNVMIQL